MLPARTRTLDAAVGRWPGILKELGVKEEFLSNRHGPCPVCGGIDRYRFDNKDERGTFYCSSCGPGDGMQLLIRLHNWTFAQAAKNIDAIIGNVIALPSKEKRTMEQKIASIRKTLKECRKVERGDPVWNYLNRRTGIESVPPDIKFHPALYHSQGGEYPAIVAIMRDMNGKGVSVHRTYLTADGQKADVRPAKKFMEGLPLNGAAVRLSKVEKRIGIAEGLETAFAAGHIFSMPVWSATNATLLEQFMPPAGVEQVVIYGDNDVSWTGHAAAYNLAKKLTLKGIEVAVEIPKITGNDWADESI